MRLGTHLKAARRKRGFTHAATALLSEIDASRLSSLEAGERLPTGEELAALCHTHTLDTATAFLWMCHELVERVVETGGEGYMGLDEDLIELADRMTTFLGQRGRL